jgi:hypothetical protein
MFKSKWAVGTSKQILKKEIIKGEKGESKIEKLYKKGNYKRGEG